MTACDPDREEDEGYVAAKAGRALSENPHPRGTIRYRQWRLGWQIRANEVRKLDDEGYQAAQAGKRLSDNPHPKGTIRYEQWRHAWHLHRDESRRTARLGVQV